MRVSSLCACVLLLVGFVAVVECHSRFDQLRSSLDEQLDREMAQVLGQLRDLGLDSFGADADAEFEVDVAGTGQAAELNKYKRCLAISGGGFRAVTGGLIAFQELEALGLMNEFRVVAGISGGTWAMARWFSDTTKHDVVNSVSYPGHTDGYKSVAQGEAANFVKHLSAFDKIGPDTPATPQHFLWRAMVADFVKVPSSTPTSALGEWTQNLKGKCSKESPILRLAMISNVLKTHKYLFDGTWHYVDSQNGGHVFLLPKTPAPSAAAPAAAIDMGAHEGVRWAVRRSDHVYRKNDASFKLVLNDWLSIASSASQARAAAQYPELQNTWKNIKALLTPSMLLSESAVNTTKLVDGGAATNVPFPILWDECEHIFALDFSGGASGSPRGIVDDLEDWIAAKRPQTTGLSWVSYDPATGAAMPSDKVTPADATKARGTEVRATGGAFGKSFYHELSIAGQSTPKVTFVQLWGQTKHLALEVDYPTTTFDLSKTRAAMVSEYQPIARKAASWFLAKSWNSDLQACHPAPAAPATTPHHYYW